MAVRGVDALGARVPDQGDAVEERLVSRGAVQEELVARRKKRLPAEPASVEQDETGLRHELMAVRLPQQDGLSALAQIKQARLDMPVLMTACDYHPAELAWAHKLGASGLLLKDFKRQRLVAAIDRVAAGGQIWSREDIRRVTGVLTSDRLAAGAGVPLTRRERDVLECITLGQTNRQIAEELGISCETVKEHVQHMIRKIGVKDRTQAAVWAVRNRLV